MSKVSQKKKKKSQGRSISTYPFVELLAVAETESNKRKNLEMGAGLLEAKAMEHKQMATRSRLF
jgi:hypothetical protein